MKMIGVILFIWIIGFALSQGCDCPNDEGDN